MQQKVGHGSKLVTDKEQKYLANMNEEIINVPSLSLFVLTVEWN